MIETRGTGDLVGLLEILEDMGKAVDIARLDDSLDEERTTLMNLLRDTQALDLVEIAKGDVALTETGKKFLSEGIEGRRKIIGKQIRRVEPFNTLLNSLKTKNRREMTKEDLLKFIEENFPSDNNEKTFGIVVNWGRYSKLMEYDSDSETLSLVS
ncbi:MAG: AAA-associated domain-containing protein [Candidatus Thermoplasmatota archaeon]|jgi:NitT/TauT family transport system ATP-binding protein|nr:AAA-associated domain-containing protein [Candidatus Thermoplasmatota archaeon]MCL5785876.1 AAA-associated domain-containing protein [Candidatus Thermoplasmatota archaeon]